MAATAGVATPFRTYRVRGTTGAVAPMRRLLEKAGQTFLQGTPVQVDSGTGFVQACAAIVSAATAIIAGMSQDPASNLTTSGVAQTLVTGQKVPNQPSAQIIPIGAPLNDGTVGIQVATPQTTYIGQLGNSNTAASAVIAQTQLAAIFGLTKDATTGFWYVDNYITTAANGACVEIINLIDPIGTLNGRVEFIVNPASQQLNV